MHQPKQCVFSDVPDVREQPSALGLTPEIVSFVARMVAGAKAKLSKSIQPTLLASVPT